MKTEFEIQAQKMAGKPEKFVSNLILRLEIGKNVNLGCYVNSQYENFINFKMLEDENEDQESTANQPSSQPPTSMAYLPVDMSHLNLNTTSQPTTNSQPNFDPVMSYVAVARKCNLSFLFIHSRCSWFNSTRKFWILR